MSGNQVGKNSTCAQRGNGRGNENQIGGNPTLLQRGDGQGRKVWKGDSNLIAGIWRAHGKEMEGEGVKGFWVDATWESSD